jgi:hypothetical protein
MTVEYVLCSSQLLITFCPMALLTGNFSDIFPYHLQEQGMVSFMHIARNVKVTELNLYEDAILDACCHNIAADDDLWYHVVEVSVLLLTCTQRSNPRSPWYILFQVLNLFQLFSVVNL